MSIKLFLFLSFFGLVSCSNDDPNDVDQGDANAFNIVTGVRFFDINGAAIGQVGNPNVKRSDRIALYPNPSNDQITIQSFNDSSLEAWLLNADKSTKFDNFDFTTNPPIIEQSVIDQQKVLAGNTDLSILSLNLKVLGKGYYRLIAKSSLNDELIENIYFDPNMTGNEMIEFLNGEF